MKLGVCTAARTARARCIDIQDLITRILTSTVRKGSMCEASKVHPVETSLLTTEVRIERSGGELKAMITQHRAIDYVVISETDESPPCGWEKHRTSCVYIIITQAIN